MKKIMKDKPYYVDNNGGVTISGGESLMQHEFVKGVFEACNKENIHTCLETALHVKSEVLKSVIPYTNMIITDIKHMNNETHKLRTKVGNEEVLKNIITITENDIPLILRIPIIPGFNDNEKDINDIGDFVVEKLNNKVLQLQLLRFRPLGKEKYDALGMMYKMEITKERANFEDEIRGYVELLRKKGINAVAGATEEIKL